ncbi:MAG: ATP-binding cassette domain-containing protein [Christensenellales bacterium]
MAKTTDQAHGADLRYARKLRRLFEKIERMEWQVDLARETIDLERRRLQERRQEKVARLDNRLKRGLYRRELHLAAPEDAAGEMIRQRLPAFDSRQKLAWRKTRQDLRRAEGLLDKIGRLLEGKTLSIDGERKLAAFQAQQAQEREAFLKGIRQTASGKSVSGAQRDLLQKDYAARMAGKAARLGALSQRLEARDKVKMQAFESRQKQIAEQYKGKIAMAQSSLLEGQSRQVYQLPEEVCLRLDRLSMVFGGLKAVDDLSFDVMQGEIFGLIGPNGAGKTTVFNCITQFYKPTHGGIYFRTREGNVLRLNHYQVHEVITKGIVRTFQNVEVIGELSIMENLLIAAHPQFRSSLFAQMFNTRKVRQEEMVLRERAMKVLDYCGLTALKDLPPVGQPYGILKRIELARTLMAGASLIILDEPAAGLNDQETVELTHLIRQIRDEFKLTIFLVEHNMGLVMDLCDHICAISFGKKLAYGTPGEIQNHPLVQEAYLGTNDVSQAEAKA